MYVTPFNEPVSDDGCTSDDSVTKNVYALALKVYNERAISLPVAPGAPVLPAAPVAPGKPEDPVKPVPPETPVLPTGPIGPGLPKEQTNIQ